jgi:redox-sensitive bicupin YhaK (pirin superfamily)
VFLDYLDADLKAGFGFGMHPHSGIATLTWQPDCDVQYEDTTGQKGVLSAGGLEWMNAAGGAWHQAQMLSTGRVRGFQLWVAMPPSVENGDSFGQYVAPNNVARLDVEGGEVMVLLGQLERDLNGAKAGSNTVVRSPIPAHQDMNYLVVQLQAGAAWHYAPPPGHDVAFAVGFDGVPLIQGIPNQRELWVFGEHGDIRIQASNVPARVLLGSAKRHAYPLVLGPSSVHTSADALAGAQAKIREMGAQLRHAGRL